MNKLAYYFLALVLVGGIGYGWGRYKTPAKVEIQEKQIVTKQTEVIYREIKQADGTVIKETVTKDTSTKESDKSSKTTAEKPKNKVGALASYDFQNKETVYGVLIQRRIGDTPFFGGIYGTTNKQIGASISLEF